MNHSPESIHPERTDLIFPELKKGPEYFCNFLNLSFEQIQALKKQIKDSKGIVRFVIHPFYDQYEYPENDDSNRDMVAQGLQRMVKANFEGSAEHKPAMFIFEEEKRIPETEESLKASMSNRAKYENFNPVYFVPTFPKDPEPNYSTAFIDRHQNGNQNYKMLIENLYSLGVRKIMLGGMYLMTPDHRVGANQASGCVNGIYKELKNSFEIEISNMSYPATRKHADKID